MASLETTLIPGDKPSRQFMRPSFACESWMAGISAAPLRPCIARLSRCRLACRRKSGNYHLFVIRRRRDALRRHLASLEIPSLVHYPIPLPRQRAFAEFNPAKCPHADLLCSRVLSLPMHPSLAEFEVEKVISGIKSFFKTK
jgi:dTDP-4-amino-4,6-dideoxygalactose transaminase